MFDDSKFFDKGYDNREVLDKGTFCAKMDKVIDKLDKIIELLSSKNSEAQAYSLYDTTDYLKDFYIESTRAYEKYKRAKESSAI